MQLIPAIVLALAGTLCAQENPMPQGEPESTPHAKADPSRDYMRLAFNFYDQSDGGGNPHLNEDMTVLEPMLLLSHSLSDKTWTTVKLQGDIISAASVEERFPAGTQSGASGDKYFGVDPTLFYAWSDQTQFSFGPSFSTEYDYSSVGAHARWSHDTDNRNDKFVVSLSYVRDSIDVIPFTGISDGTDTRSTIGIGAGWSRIISPELTSTFNYDLTLQDGFLSTSYNSVVAAGTEVREVLPDSRTRHSLHERLRYLASENLAIDAGLGLYTDDWGIRAWTPEVGLQWEAIPGDLIIRPSYRYHTQSGVDYFVEDGAASIPEFRTQDSDLDALSDHTLGIRFLFPHATFFGDNVEFEFGLDYTTRSDDLDWLSVVFGYKWRF